MEKRFEMLNYVNKKEYEEIYNRWKHLRDISHGLEILLDNQKKQIELEYKRAEYWKAKALYPNSEPYVEGDMETIKYIKS